MNIVNTKNAREIGMNCLVYNIYRESKNGLRTAARALTQKWKKQILDEYAESNSAEVKGDVNGTHDGSVHRSSDMSYDSDSIRCKKRMRTEEDDEETDNIITILSASEIAEMESACDTANKINNLNARNGREIIEHVKANMMNDLVVDVNTKDRVIQSVDHEYNNKKYKELSDGSNQEIKDNEELYGEQGIESGDKMMIDEGASTNYQSEYKNIVLPISTRAKDIMKVQRNNGKKQSKGRKSKEQGMNKLVEDTIRVNAINTLVKIIGRDKTTALEEGILINNSRNISS
jgi:phage anti-repressor protein